MLMEGRALVVSRQNLDTKQWGTQDESYTQKPWLPLRGTRGNSQNYRVGQPTILVARMERYDPTICQELRHLPTEQSGQTCTLLNAPIERSSRPTMEINRLGLHYGLSNLGLVLHHCSGRWSPNQNESFHTLQPKPGCTAVRNIIPQRNHTTTRHTQRRHHR